MSHLKTKSCFSILLTNWKLLVESCSVVIINSMITKTTGPVGILVIIQQITKRSNRLQKEEKNNRVNDLCGSIWILCETYGVSLIFSLSLSLCLKLTFEIYQQWFVWVIGIVSSNYTTFSSSVKFYHELDRQ